VLPSNNIEKGEKILEYFFHGCCRVKKTNNSECNLFSRKSIQKQQQQQQRRRRQQQEQQQQQQQQQLIEKRF
jgi:hypothetical protein